MYRILKYELKITDRQSILLKQFARPLAVAEQNGKLMLWAAVGTDVDATGYKYEIAVEIVGTGHSVTLNKLKPHIGSVVMSNGLVWHVFAEWKPRGED